MHISLLIGTGAAIAALSLAPAPSVPSVDLSHADKVEHAAAYAVLTFFSIRFFQTLSARKPLVFGGSIILCTLFGVMIEIAQGTLTTTRAAEASDVAADAVGAAITAFAMLMRERKRDACRSHI
jgi:VanZ family protein